MFDEMKRSKYEETAHHYVIDLYNNIADNYNVTITDWNIPEDPYSKWDMSCTIDGKVTYIENKTRDSYSFNELKDKGFYLSAKKNDGKNTIFNYLFPEDNIIMITNSDKLKDLKPLKTKVRHKAQCDPESPETEVLNYIVPYNRFWIYQINPFKLINKPTRI